MFEAMAWVKKYFNVASEENKFCDFIDKGIKDNRLTSRPIQMLNHEEDEILINVPNIKVIKNNNL